MVCATVFLFASCVNQLEGVLKMTGNEPFTMLVLRMDDGTVVQVAGNMEKELSKLQNKRVILKGSFSETPGSGLKPPSFKVENIVKVFEE